jgi:hypothetical protein
MMQKVSGSQRETKHTLYRVGKEPVVVCSIRCKSWRHTQQSGHLPACLPACLPFILLTHNNLNLESHEVIFMYVRERG